MPVALLASLGVSPLVLSAQTSRTALPGTVNYVEGQASINGNPLNTKQDGNTQLEPNQTLSTGNGKVEMLLSPGVFVRAGNNSEIRMVSTGLVDPTIEVVRGEVMIEVDQKPKDARIDVLEHGATASIVKYGLYRFNGDQGRIEVIDGQLQVTENGKTKEFGKGNAVVINGEPLKTIRFDRNAEDDLYRWSSVRSAYLAEANAVNGTEHLQWATVRIWGAGWYWNPWYFDMVLVAMGWIFLQPVWISVLLAGLWGLRADSVRASDTRGSALAGSVRSPRLCARRVTWWFRESAVVSPVAAFAAVASAVVESAVAVHAAADGGNPLISLRAASGVCGAPPTLRGTPRRAR